MKKPETRNQKPEVLLLCKRETRLQSTDYRKDFFQVSVLWFLVSLVLWFLVSFVAGCAKKQETAKQDEVIPVRVMKVELRDMQQTLDYVGNIKAQDEAVVYPKVNGKIFEKLKEDGSPVDKGETIMFIDRDEVGFTFEKAPVESPLTGIIGRVYVDKGTSVTPQTPVALIVDMDKVKIELDVPEKYLPKVSLGQSAEISIDAYPEERFIGALSKISPVVDLDTRTAPVETLIPNSDHRLKPGMFSRVKLVIEEHKSVPVILKEAILGKGSDTYVYLIDGKVAYQKSIKLGIHQGPYFEVIEGLKKGDLVVIMGQQRLRDGVSVNVEEETGNQSFKETRNQSTETRK